MLTLEMSNGLKHDFINIIQYILGLIISVYASFCLFNRPYVFILLALLFTFFTHAFQP